MEWPWEHVFLARHGETEWNVEGRRQGQLDSQLTELGWGQAELVAERAAGLGLDALFVSPLGRATQTAGIIADRLALKSVVIPELTENDHGEFAGMTNEEIEIAHPGELARRDADKYQWRFPGGESYADVDQRARTALATIVDGGARRPLIVSHNMISRMLIGALLQVGPGAALQYELRHGEVLHLTLASQVAKRLN